MEPAKANEIKQNAEQLNKELAHDDAHTNIHTFHPDAPPDKKASAAKKADLDRHGSIGQRVIADIADSSEDPSSKPVEFPKWYRVGWKQVADPGSKEAGIEVYDSVLKELYYSNLWEHAAVVFVSFFATWFIAYFSFSVMWLAIVLTFVATYFKITYSRFVRDARSDAARDLALSAETIKEPIEWLNEFIRRFWLIYEPILSATVIKQVDSVLAASTPGFLDSIRLTTFTLGTKPPRVENVVTYTKVEDNTIEMVWNFGFEPNDSANMTREQLRRKVRPKIVLTARVGRGVVGAGIPVLVEDMTFSGKMKIKMSLAEEFPYVHTVRLCFLEEPKVDFVLKPIGGETFGFDIKLVRGKRGRSDENGVRRVELDIPGLAHFIHSLIHSNLRPMMYYPEEYSIDVGALMKGAAVESAIGILKLVLYNARNIRNAEKFGTSDPYVKFGIGPLRKELARTKVISNSLSPYWNETHYLVLNNLVDDLHLEVYDSNVGRDRLLGSSTFKLESLVKKPKDSITAPVLFDNVKSGEIYYDVEWLPIAERVPDQPIQDSNIGIIRLTIDQAIDLDPKKSAVGEYNPYAELYFNKKLIHTTKKIKRSNSPSWNDTIELFVPNKQSAHLGVIIRDARDFAEDPAVGVYRSPLKTLLASLESKIDTFSLMYADSGKIKLHCEWKPILIDYMPNASGYVDPIGVVKAHIKSAQDLKNVEALGKSDPYVQALLGSKYRDRTAVIDNNLNPVWTEEYLYVPVHSLRETVLLEVVDHELRKKGELLGRCEVPVDKLAAANEDGTYKSNGTLDETAKLFINKEQRGHLSYEATFYPREADEVQSQSGTLVLYLNEAKFDKPNLYVRCLKDNDAYPFYQTNAAVYPNPMWEEATDFFVKELDFSRLSLELCQTGSSTPVGVLDLQVKTLIEKMRNELSKDEEGIWLTIPGIAGAKINIYAKYIPTIVPIEASESVNNQGNLQVTVIEAKNLPAADRSGTSDPYVIFVLNGQQVHKTKTVKKNLNPVFNESFQVQVKSRTSAEFYFEVFDWNAVSNATKLGIAEIDLRDLNPFEGVEREIPLAENQGSVFVRLLFRPEFIMKKRATTGTFAVAGNAAANVASAAGHGIVGAGSTIVGGGAKVVGTGAKMVGGGARAVGSGFGLLGNKKGSMSEETS
ncbi:5902_t:CDS:10 [Paraglomus occultum]|uniref:5902_t:CDS:1 n=1 Tax=Paraglomus occultum TaxID=144539 RepID=A0A9N9B862_9GLOM|nr:5902_t:CDS:10 [Paraglomus occultum]